METIGWGTLAYGTAAGMCAGLAMVFLPIGARNRRFDAVMVSFGIFAILSAINAIVTVRLHLSSSISDYEDWFKLFGLANLATIVAMVLLVAAWTRSVPRWAVKALVIASGPIVVLQIALPNGLFVGDVTNLRNVSLFGESFVVHEGTASPWRPAYELYALAGAVISITALIRSYRGERRSYAILVASAVMVTYSVGAYDGFVDFGVFSTPYYTPFGLLVTSIAGAAFLAERRVRIDEQLHEQTIRLEETVVERTAALIDTNRRLEDQLSRQRRTTRSLAALSDQFERSNIMVDPTPATIETGLRALFKQLATILPAATVELRLDSGRFDGLLPRSLAFHQPETPHDPDSDSGDEIVIASEAITIGPRTVGALNARSIDQHSLTTESTNYLALAAEHLSGLIHRLALVAQNADSAVEDERQRIAMELHDSVTQRMYSVSFLADAAVHKAADDPTAIGELVQRIREMVLSSMAELHVLLLELRPHSFADAELHVLLEQLADSLVSTSESEVVADVSEVASIPTKVKTALYRISQEAVSNACRHSHADEITIELVDDAGAITLVIRDDGVGFDPAAIAAGAGLDNLRARARSVDATIDISSRPGVGTTITVRVTRPVDSTKVALSAQAADA